MNKRSVAACFSVLVLLVAAAFAWAYWSGDYSDDPEVAAVEKERDRQFADPDSMDEEQMRDAGRELMEMSEGLSDEQKRELWERSAGLFVPMMMKVQEKRWDEFLALSPEKQQEELDKRIDEQLALEARGFGRGGPPGPPPSPEKVDEFFKKMNDWTTPEQRAKFETIMGMYNDRRKERGLPEFGFGRN